MVLLIIKKMSIFPNILVKWEKLGHFRFFKIKCPHLFIFSHFDQDTAILTEIQPFLNIH